MLMDKEELRTGKTALLDLHLKAWTLSQRIRIQSKIEEPKK